MRQPNNGDGHPNSEAVIHLNSKRRMEGLSKQKTSRTILEDIESSESFSKIHACPRMLYI